MLHRSFIAYLRRFVRVGNLAVELKDEVPVQVGDRTGPLVRVKISDHAVRRLMVDPQLALGECYVDGDITIDGDDIQGLMDIVTRNVHSGPKERSGNPVLLWWRWLRRWRDQNNDPHNARRNVAHHYDLPPALYDLFLDSDRQYSCAYFREPDLSLEAAQAAKKAHIATKLVLSPDMHVLDIGCGWGGMALTLARDHGVRVTGITLSEEQLRIARDRAERAGLSDRVTFELADYRTVKGRFDRIVSVGMFEHVGVPHFATYFDTVRDLLTPDGVALIHTIGWTGPPSPSNPWITKYIFPGGYVPALSEVAEAIQTSGLRIGDIECLRLHYALTLRHWFDRFSAKAEIAAQINDERFVRMWRYYLAASEQTFRNGPQDVFQFQLVRRIDAVPITRDYMYVPTLADAVRQAAE